MFVLHLKEKQLIEYTAAAYAYLTPWTVCYVMY